MNTQDIKNESFWSYLDESEKELLGESFLLLSREEQDNHTWHDYAFVVFPAAKAYEGFLKKLFFDLGFLSQQQYQGDRYRIGRALNPNLEKELRDESAYDQLAKYCDNPSLPDFLWQTWRNSRNLLFHWFPWHRNCISLAEARERIETIVQAMEKATTSCKRVS